MTHALLPGVTARWRPLCILVLRKITFSTVTSASVLMHSSSPVLTAQPTQLSRRNPDDSTVPYSIAVPQYETSSHVERETKKARLSPGMKTNIAPRSAPLRGLLQGRMLSCNVVRVPYYGIMTRCQVKI